MAYTSSITLYINLTEFNKILLPIFNLKNKTSMKFVIPFAFLT